MELQMYSRTSSIALNFLAFLRSIPCHDRSFLSALVLTFHHLFFGGQELLDSRLLSVAFFTFGWYTPRTIISNFVFISEQVTGFEVIFSPINLSSVQLAVRVFLSDRKQHCLMITVCKNGSRMRYWRILVRRTIMPTAFCSKMLHFYLLGIMICLCID